MPNQLRAESAFKLGAVQPSTDQYDMRRGRGKRRIAAAESALIKEMADEIRCCSTQL